MLSLFFGGYKMASSLVVNTDTYISLADCDVYLSAQYVSTDAKLTAWNALLDGDCDVYLRQAAAIIDAHPLQGFKALTTQTMGFPRILYTDANYLLNSNVRVLDEGGFYTQPAVPAAVKNEQCELALELAQGTTSQASQRAELQRQGVRSYSIGKLSETLTGASADIVSYKARQMLLPFTGGGFRI